MLRGCTDRVAGLVYAVHSRPVNGYQMENVYRTGPGRSFWILEQRSELVPLEVQEGRFAVDDGFHDPPIGKFQYP